MPSLIPISFVYKRPRFSLSFFSFHYLSDQCAFFSLIGSPKRGSKVVLTADPEEFIEYEPLRYANERFRCLPRTSRRRRLEISGSLPEASPARPSSRSRSRSASPVANQPSSRALRFQARPRVPRLLPTKGRGIFVDVTPVLLRLPAEPCRESCGARRPVRGEPTNRSASLAVAGVSRRSSRRLTDVAAQLR